MYICRYLVALFVPEISPPETYIIHASEPDTLSYMHQHQQEYEIWIWRKQLQSLLSLLPDQECQSHSYVVTF